MTAGSPEIPVTGGVPGLGVRWIFPGRPETAVARWIGRFWARTEPREDTYLLAAKLSDACEDQQASSAVQMRAQHDWLIVTRGG